MRRRDEPGLECRRREVDALGQHAVEEALEALDVAGGRLGIRIHATGTGEEEAEHAADMIGRQRNAGTGRSVRQARDEAIGRAPELCVETRRLESAQRREAGGHRDWIAGQRARLVDGTEWRDVLHDFPAAAEGAHRHAAADDLAERRQVGPDPVELLRAALRDAEAGHHFVEDQHGAVLRALLA
jgi:hypothetical protein